MPDAGRERRGVATQQRLQHELATHLGQALQQLIGAGDHHLALLDPALGDRGLLGQPFAIGLHGIALGRRVGAGLQFERRQELLGVGEVVAREGGGGHCGRAHVGCLLAQTIDLDRQQVGLRGAGGNAVELTAPELDELAEGALRLRHGLGGSRDACEQQHEQCEASERPHSVR